MKTKIYLSFKPGGWGLMFEKTFYFPFTPFYGLTIVDSNEDYEETIRIEKTSYCHVEIYYDVKDQQMYIDISNSWRHGVRDDVVDNTIASFLGLGWTRTDTTNVADLKELMNRKTNN